MTKSESAPDNIPITQETYQLIRQVFGWILTAVLVLLGIIFGATLSNQWDTVLKYLNAVPFSQLDPIFGKDISFYVFTLPLLDFLQGWGIGVIVLSMVFTGGIYLLIYGLRTEVQLLTITFL